MHALPSSQSTRAAHVTVFLPCSRMSCAACQRLRTELLRLAPGVLPLLMLPPLGGVRYHSPKSGISRMRASTVAPAWPECYTAAVFVAQTSPGPIPVRGSGGRTAAASQSSFSCHSLRRLENECCPNRLAVAGGPRSQGPGVYVPTLERLAASRLHTGLSIPGFSRLKLLAQSSSWLMHAPSCASAAQAREPIRASLLSFRS